MTSQREPQPVGRVAAAIDWTFVRLTSRRGAPAALLLFTLFFYWKIIFTNRVMFPWDAADFFYPYFAFVHEELRHFRLPLWDPYVFSGYPIIGDLEAQIFYPFNWLFVLLRPSAPLNYKLVELQLIFHFFLAGLFMYYLARDFTGDRAAALLAGALFMYSGDMVAHTQHIASVESLAWYPAIFLVARRALFRNDYYLAFAGGVLFALLNLVGHWQHSVYLGLLLFLYFAQEAIFGRSGREEPAGLPGTGFGRAALWPRWILMLALIGGVGAALAAIQIVPTQELGRYSIRNYVSYWDVSEGSNPVFLWTLFLPNFLGGLNGAYRWYPGDISFNYVFLSVPGCLLALLGLVETVRRRNFFWLLLILFFTALSFGRQAPFGLDYLVARTPILNLFRNMITFFDVANFALCLMAGVGAAALIGGRFSSPGWQRWLPPALALLLAAAVVCGFAFPWLGLSPGWYHMLAVLAVSIVLISAGLARRIAPAHAVWALLALALFQFCQYSMYQPFNWTIDNPNTYVSYEQAAHTPRTLNFLRADPVQDFRVAAFAEYPWSANGPNVWRIRSVFGWNPIALRAYQEYIRDMVQVETIAHPQGGGDHDGLMTPLLDLLGVKYVLGIGDDLDRLRGFHQSGKFSLVFSDSDWWYTYRNKNYLSRAWFYPKAYVLDGDVPPSGVIKSSWFDARRVLLLDREQAAAAAGSPDVERLAVIALPPEKVAAASGGLSVEDPYCSERQVLYGDWAGPGSWIRFDVDLGSTRGAAPGRYLLLMRYTAAWEVEQALVRAGVHSGAGAAEEHGPVALGRTPGWDCRKTRTADLGTFELRPGVNQITITVTNRPPVNFYGAWLVRLPEQPGGTKGGVPDRTADAGVPGRRPAPRPTAAPPVPPTGDNPPPPPHSLADSPPFSFSDFRGGRNWLTFTASLPEDGFVFVNEIDYPGWQAYIDDRPAATLRADGIFRALRVSAGSHRIRFRFWPRRFWLGAGITALTLAAFALCSFRRRRARRAMAQVRLANAERPREGVSDGTD